MPRVEAEPFTAQAMLDAGWCITTPSVRLDGVLEQVPKRLEDVFATQLTEIDSLLDASPSIDIPRLLSFAFNTYIRPIQDRPNASVRGAIASMLDSIVFPRHPLASCLDADMRSVLRGRGIHAISKAYPLEKGTSPKALFSTLIMPLGAASHRSAVGLRHRFDVTMEDVRHLYLTAPSIDGESGSVFYKRHSALDEHPYGLTPDPTWEVNLAVLSLLVLMKRGYRNALPRSRDEFLASAAQLGATKDDFQFVRKLLDSYHRPASTAHFDPYWLQSSSYAKPRHGDIEPRAISELNEIASTICDISQARPFAWLTEGIESRFAESAPRAFQNTRIMIEHHDAAPRIGLAYRPLQHASLHGHKGLSELCTLTLYQDTNDTCRVLASLIAIDLIIRPAISATQWCSRVPEGRLKRLLAPVTDSIRIEGEPPIVDSAQLQISLDDISSDGLEFCRRVANAVDSIVQFGTDRSTFTESHAAAMACHLLSDNQIEQSIAQCDSKVTESSEPSVQRITIRGREVSSRSNRPIGESESRMISQALSDDPPGREQILRAGHLLAESSLQRILGEQTIVAYVTAHRSDDEEADINREQDQDVLDLQECEGAPLLYEIAHGLAPGTSGKIKVHLVSPRQDASRNKARIVHARLDDWQGPRLVRLVNKASQDSTQRDR